MSDYRTKLKSMIWSFSRCHSFENCKYEWYLNYLLKDEKGKNIYKTEQNFYAEFGKFCHEILQKIFNSDFTIQEANLYYKKYFKDLESFGVCKNTKDKYYFLGLVYFKTLNLNWLSDYEILGVEKKCQFNIEETEFIGYIDLLIRHKKSDSIIIVDHKSSDCPIGKKENILKSKILEYNSYKKQLYIYCEVVFKEYGRYPNELWWNYFKVKKWVKVPFVYEEFEGSKKWAVGIIAQIVKEENFEPKINYFYCNNLCGFRNSCDYMMGSK